LKLAFPWDCIPNFFQGAFSNSNDEYYQTDIFKKQDDSRSNTFNAFISQLGFENNSLNFKQYATEGEYNALMLKYIAGRETNKPGTTSVLCR
jgi:NTE family protein